MNNENPNKYIITYSNWLVFEGCILAFRKQELFNISDTPKWIPFNEKSQSWILKRRQLTKKKAKELLVKEEKKVDISELQWYLQEQLNEVFNLEL